ncbi:MAG: YbaB/EbfC family nucleoid-associated protein [Crocinitomicaceae bacterium]
MFTPDMLEKLQHLKQQSEASKEKLNNTLVTEDAGGGLVRITLNGNRELKGLEINAELNDLDKSDLEDLLTVAFNRALEKVNNLNEQEVMSSARNLFPGM